MKQCSKIMLYCIAHLLKPLSMNDIPSVILSVCIGHCFARRCLWGRRRGADIVLLRFLGSLGLEHMLWYLTELHASCSQPKDIFLLMCDASIGLDSVAGLAAWCISPEHCHLGTCSITLGAWSVTFS